MIILKQEDIDYSKDEIGRINEELLDTAPGSIRALLDEIIAGENIELSDEATEVEEIPYSELSGRVVEYISDIRNGQQIILIVANKKHASFFDTRFSVPPWYKSKKAIPPELIEFILAKKVTSTENRIFSFNEDIEVTKTLIREVQKPIPQSEKYFKVSTKDGKVTITGYKGKGGAVVIPATIRRKPVTSIDSFAFYRCTGLTSVSIPASVTSIGGFAFSECTGLTSISIPASITSIDGSAFADCTGLTAIQADANNQAYSSRGGVLFSKTGGTLIAYPAGLKGQYAIPASVTGIGYSAFEGCTGLTAVSIPTSVTSIGRSAFEGCTSLTSVSIPASVTSIGWAAFSGCTGLTSVSIPESVTSIDSITFLSCRRLTSIRIGANVRLEGGKDPSFDNNFDNYYNTNGKKAGVYTQRGGAWSYVAQ
ncbi:MAG: hypothetical protein Ta2G_10800 [Termitinemataceae bacterium]|nr:MAG: hypothetical protein Ta2G_10800 [Termitinemataceae bacterium]